MRLRSVVIVIASLFPFGAQATGFESATIPTSPPIDIGIWYPSSSPVVTAVNIPFGQALAVDGEILGEDLPLIVVSHGNRGRMAAHSHTALALAEAGYVVVALTHPGDNYQNPLTSPFDWLVSRPADISETIDFMLSDWVHADRIDADRIGVYGFSAGGYTALASAGAVIDFDVRVRFCRDNPQEHTCGDDADGIVAPAAFYPQLRAVTGDPRIGAISVSAPGFSYSFDREALAEVTVPVQIWSGTLDESVPHETNGALLAANLPHSPDVHVVEGAGHFAFTAICPSSVRQYDRYAWNIYCVDADGFDRADFHQVFHRGIVEFFNSTLSH